MTKPHFRRTATGATIPMRDGLRNLVSGMGTDRDKASHSFYSLDLLSDVQIESAYRTSKLAQKIIDMPAEDAGREWREWQAEGADISKIEAEEKCLNTRGKLIEALRIARFRGGSAIMIGTGDTDTEEPLDPSKMGKGGLKYLTVLNKGEINPEEIQRDPRESGHGRPEFFSITAADTNLRIHHSRLVLFRGPTVPGHSQITGQWWGDSVLNAVLAQVQRDDGAAANADSLLFEAKVDVLKVKNLTENLRSGGEQYEKLLLQRFQLASLAKGINGAFILDSEEEYEQKQASFGSVPDLMDRFALRVSAAAEIPLTLLYGQSPGGLNATGDADTRGYYDRVKVRQTLDVEPELTILDECLIRSALGDRPADVHYNWKPLWQPSDKERAENADKLMTAAEKMERLGVPIEAVVKAAVNAATESGAFPGLEGYVKDAGGFDGDNEENEDRDDTLNAADAAPRTLYIRRPVLNGDEILAWAKGQGFKATLPADDLHVTIAFSREPVDWMKVGEAWDEEIKVNAGGPRLMERFGDARVLLFASSHLSWRHEETKRAGAKWDHPEYQPHVTISYAADAPELDEIQPYTGEIILGPEVFEEVNPKWFEGVKEQ
ncbi:DUF1073 domain-containing protein [Aliisedimentitalea scapharcae]|uniref:Anti-CBASS protein Acb1 n=1 Tax=Aliisedimentitalea scapharcae TaxID=1524259 RepID=A0ABZ2XUI4_9RHOB